MVTDWRVNSGSGVLVGVPTLYYAFLVPEHIRVFPILYQISLIRRIRWIQAFICLKTYSWLFGVNGYDSWLSRLWVQIQEYLFLEGKV